MDGIRPLSIVVFPGKKGLRTRGQTLCWRFCLKTYWGLVLSLCLGPGLALVPTEIASGFGSASESGLQSIPEDYPEDYLQKPIQAPEPVVIDENYQFEYPPHDVLADLPDFCLRYIPWQQPCKPSREWDRKLEQEYWKHLINMDSEGMKQWIRRMQAYTRLSGSPNRFRLQMLSIFGHLHVYSQNNRIIDPFKTGWVLGAFDQIRLAKEGMPRSPNLFAFDYAMQNFTQFALGLTRLGVRSAHKMIELGEIYGDYGLAGPVGAVAHLMGARDKDVVRRGIEIYDDCHDSGLCARETSIAPFQRIGTWITQAEAYAYLGEFEKMDEVFDKTTRLAEQRQWPFRDRIPEIREELIRPGGLVDQWKNQRGTGSIRFPLGVAHKRDACAFCHVGNSVPEWYHLNPDQGI